MELTPVDRGVTSQAQLRMPDKLEVKSDGNVEVHAAATDKVEIKKQPKEKDGMIANTAKTILSGVGLSSGVVGGGIIGAGVGAGGEVVAGLIGSNLTMASLSTGAMIGGVAGAAIFGAAGAYGGWKFASALIQGGKYLNKLLFTKEPLSPEQSAALNTIKQVEDNPKEAQKALKFITSNLKADESLEKETELYVGLLNHFSNKKSNEALSAYSTIKNNLPPGDARKMALDELGKMSQAFKTPEEAMDALYCVLENLNAKDTIAGEGEVLRSVADTLKKCSADYGVVGPDVAGGVYQTIKKNFAPNQRKEAIDATLGQFAGQKMDPKELLLNFNTLVETRQKGEDLAAETKNLLWLIEKAGSGEVARLAYQTTKENFAPGTRKEALDNFFELNGIEKSPKDAAAVMATIKKNLYEGESMKAQIKEYTEMRKVLGDSSSSAMEAYKFITTNFKKGENRDDAISQMGKIAAAEKAIGQSAGDAAGDFAFLYSHMSPGEKLMTQTDEFITLLQSKKSSSAAQKAYLAAKFKETGTG